MALTYTPKGELGSRLPQFSLKSLQGKLFSSTEIERAPAKLIAFICGHCPYVQAIEERLIDLGAELKKLSVPFVAICSNDPSDYPEDTPEQLLKRYDQMKYTFNYLIDDSQSVAKEFDAVCTPDFFVYDKDNRLSYRGRLDDSWKNSSLVKKRELLDAIQMILKSGQAPTEQLPSMGCSIKWRN